MDFLSCLFGSELAIPVIAASLIGGLISVTGTIVGRVLVALGVGVVTYTGVQTGIDSLLSNLDSAISGVPADILGLLGFMRVFLSCLFGSELVGRVLVALGVFLSCLFGSELAFIHDAD